MSCPEVQLALRLSGKKTRKITTICFHRGGAGGVGSSSVCGSSNHPSMPVRRSTRVASTWPRAPSSQDARSADASHRASASASANR